MPYCPEKYAAMIEQFRSFSKVSEMMNLFQSFDDGADLFNNPIILNMMNQTVNTTNNTANPKNSKDGNTPGKTDVKAPPPKKLWQTAHKMSQMFLPTLPACQKASILPAQNPLPLPQVF